MKRDKPVVRLKEGALRRMFMRTVDAARRGMLLAAAAERRGPNLSLVANECVGMS